MKKSELRKIIKEEIQRLNENTDFKSLEFEIKDFEGGKIKIYLEQDSRNSNTYYLKAKQNGRNIALDPKEEKKALKIIERKSGFAKQKIDIRIGNY